MVQYLKHLLPLRRRQGMVQAGKEVEEDHGHPKHRDAHQVDQAPIGLGTQDQQHSTSHSQQGTHTVGHGVENFFPYTQPASTAGIGQRFGHHGSSFSDFKNVSS